AEVRHRPISSSSPARTADCQSDGGSHSAPHPAPWSNGMRRPLPAKISLLLADVDGTLVTRDKILTERAQAAVRALHEANIRFAITSGRPPRGMAMLIDPLKIGTAVAGFNGGIFVNPDL